MADPGEPTRAVPPKRPRWVKIFGIIIVVVAVLVVVLALISGGEHGPGRHLPGGDDTESHTPPVQHTP